CERSRDRSPAQPEFCTASVDVRHACLLVLVSKNSAQIVPFVIASWLSGLVV
ncbi:hypothetical protein Y032_0050g1882, partial [Ancylostoma ceylanicum]